jgi:hypothetical protein
MNLLTRPPQYIAIAFDNCLENMMWDQTMMFCKEMARKNIHIRFTYFLSAVTILSDEKSQLYQGPHHKAGKAAIDFGGNQNEVLLRAKNISSLFEQGHEIASHACGHFNANDEDWSESDWENELDSYFSLLTNVAANNGLPPGSSLNLKPSKDVVGFRVPYLAFSKALFSALKSRHFLYDTSQNGSPNYWPDNKSGFWNFPLGYIEYAGSPGGVISMDYCFFARDSKEVEDTNEAHLKIYRERMLKSYIKYFDDNYNGNRAPIHIGHHFYPYNQGIYWEALKDFVEAVGDKPEVCFVTYTQLANILEELPQETIEAYQKCEFEPMEISAESDETRQRARQKPRLYSREELSRMGIVSTCGCKHIWANRSEKS